MFSLKDYCIGYLVQLIKSGGLGSSGVDLSALPSELLEYLFNLLKKIERFKLTDEILDRLTATPIEYLNLSNEEKLDFGQWASTLQRQPPNTRLKQLDLSHSAALVDDSLAAVLAHYQSLRFLKLSDCINIHQGASFRSVSKHLVYLNLRGCVSLNINELLKLIQVNCKRLAGLVLSKIGRVVDDDLVSLREFEELEVLKLNHCDAITAQALEHISGMKRLKHLYLNYCALLSERNAFRSLTSETLESLEISYCFINNESLGLRNAGAEEAEDEESSTSEEGHNIFKLKSLNQLIVKHNRLTPELLVTLSSEENRPFLERLRRLDLRDSVFIKPESALCLYSIKSDDDFELYISTVLQRRSTLSTGNGSAPGGTSSNGRVSLKELYQCFNNSTITSKNQIQLNRASLYLSILEKQKHFPMILIGEDESLQAKIVKNVLERRHFDVRIAENGKTAFEMYCENPWFVLVIMDIYMPIINGLNSIRMIRQYEKSNNRKRTPIIICSGNESIPLSTTQQDINSAYDAFISKPLKPSVFDLILKLTSQNPTLKTITSN